MDEVQARIERAKGLDKSLPKRPWVMQNCPTHQNRTDLVCYAIRDASGRTVNVTFNGPQITDLRNLAPALAADLEAARAEIATWREALTHAQKREAYRFHELNLEMGALVNELTVERARAEKTEADTQAALNLARGFEQERDQAIRSHVIHQMTHPTGACSCAGEGACTWCKMDDYRTRAVKAERERDEAKEMRGAALASFDQTAEIHDLRTERDALNATVANLGLEVEELRTREQWQPIETAPKDGTVVMLSCPSRDFPILCKWDESMKWIDLIAPGRWVDATHWRPNAHKATP